MATRKNGLGKGLDSLIPSSGSRMSGNRTSGSESVQHNTNTESQKNTSKDIVKIKISLIEPNRDQPRKAFDEESLQELANSIRQFGILQPLLVRKKETYYEIIAGERRWRAAKIAGLKEVPVIVKELNERETVEISLIENIQRQNLNPIEEAIAYRRLIEDFSLKQEEIAERVSKSRTAVTNSIRLLKLDPRVQQMVIDEKLSTGHARALLPIEIPDLQYETAMRIFDRKLSVRETEKIVKKILNPKSTEKQEDVSEAEKLIYQNIEERIRTIMGTKVQIQRKDKNKGKIEIEYYSADELERLVELFESIT